MRQERLTELAAALAVDEISGPELSIVIPALNEAACIVETLCAVDQQIAGLVRSHEIILVDDGSTDGTLLRVATLAHRLPLTTIRLSRNFGKEQAMMAGLAQARGNAVIVMDADLQEPVDAMATMVAHWRAGWDMAYAVRAHRQDEGRLKRGLTRAFYRLVNAGSDAPIPEDARDFRLMDRRVVDALLALPERNRFMKGLYGWVGFRSIAVPVELAPRAEGVSKFGLANLFRLALTGMTAFTSWPLRVWTGVGLVMSIIALVYGSYLGLRTVLFGHDVPGWSTLAVGMFLLGGVQLFSIGVLGEYLARIFTEVKGRPGYIIAELRRSQDEKRG
ncbi:glycosyltransferase [Paracoccus sediminis]|uniref:Glycosyltransferase n=1 Tax=Paracoccus sediminis TaxID=1214787 RepID=A0A238XTL7_9RHOB|nr:glycosyltransferase family 2 protein [Paracoccus sediminis]TBN47858.1 glycosyltransferase [Paracoccus sediminis]SNR62060.1 Glycosyltransferase involved in cell wall bisynthesis [Paracoccus sediminis]